MEERYGAAQAASDEWRRRAEWALRRGDEDLAREALKRRRTFEVCCMKPHQCLLMFISAASGSMTCADEGAARFEMMRTGPHGDPDTSKEVMLPQLHLVAPLLVGSGSCGMLIRVYLKLRTAGSSSAELQEIVCAR